MTLVEQLISATEAYRVARGIRPSRVSVLLFNDGKRLPAILAGGDLHTASFERAMQWLSDNWPEGAEWPADVPRPHTPTLAPEAAGENDNPAAESLTPEECGA